MEKFSELQYQRPDVKTVKKQIQGEIAKLKKAASYEEVRTAYLACETLTGDLATAYVIAHIRNTMDKSDAFYEGEMKFFNTELAKFMLVQKKLSQTLLGSAFRKSFEQEFGSIFLKTAEEQLKTQSPLVMLDMIRESNLQQEYSKTAATAKTTFRGEEVNFYGLLKHMQSTDRAERKEAFEAWAALYERISPELDAQYGKFVKLRVRMAKKLHFPSYIELAYLNKNRFDYTKEDVARFREQVRTVITPACQRIFEKQRQRLGVDKLRYYDEQLVFPDGNATPVGDRAYLVNAAREMYRALSPETGEFFDFMTEHELFDLETRPNKHLGGYCTFLQKYKAPFIFSNFNGTSADADVLTHEAGHAFEAYTASRLQKIDANVSSTSEINEIHSMTMEHFAYPWMDKFFGDKADEYRYAHLWGALSVVPYLVSVDEFQHRVFENPAMGPMEWRRTWREIEQKYMPWRDYDGNAFLEGGGFWMQKQHIFLYPFYYIDYALAQMCAFEFYDRMKADREQAWADYLRLCRAGGSLGYFELLKVANLRNPFETGSVEAAVAGVIEEIEKAPY